MALSRNNKKKVVYAFIDSQNLNLGAKSARINLDFAKFRIYLKDKYKVERAFLFLGKISGMGKLYSLMRRSGFELVFKTVSHHFYNGKKVIKGNVDAELVLYTVDMQCEYDKAVIVSGDGDFYCLADYLENKNKLAKIIVPNKNYSRLLRKFADKIVSIEEFRSKIEKK